MTKPIYYRVELNQGYLCGVQHGCTAYWSPKQSFASYTTNKEIAKDWAKVNGGEVKSFS